MVCALAHGRSCSRVGWIQFRAERDCNGKYNCNGKFNDNCNHNGKLNGNGNTDCDGAGGGDGEPCGVEGAAGWGGGV